VQAYYGALLTQRQVQVAEAGLETAQAIETSSRARVESGMVVESDLLSAQVATAARKQELIAAQNALSLARTQLALAVGVSSDTLFEPQDALTNRTFSPPPVAELGAHRGTVFSIVLPALTLACIKWPKHFLESLK
jgi:outer membrane protein TolC